MELFGLMALFGALEVLGAQIFGRRGARKETQALLKLADVPLLTKTRYEWLEVQKRPERFPHKGVRDVAVECETLTYFLFGIIVVWVVRQDTEVGRHPTGSRKVLPQGPNGLAEHH